MIFNSSHLKEIQTQCIEVCYKIFISVPLREIFSPETTNCPQYNSAKLVATKNGLVRTRVFTNVSVSDLFNICTFKNSLIIHKEIKQSYQRIREIFSPETTNCLFPFGRYSHLKQRTVRRLPQTSHDSIV